MNAAYVDRLCACTGVTTADVIKSEVQISLRFPDEGGIVCSVELVYLDWF